MLKMNFKKVLALLASVLLLCSLIPVGALLAANADDNNILVNGDFEAGEANWENVWGSCGVSMVAGRNSANAMSIASGQWKIVRQKVTVESNTDYTITVWAKDVKDMTLLVKDGADTKNVKQMTVNGGADWTVTTMNLNTGEYTELYICFMGNVADSKGTFDDASMVKVGGGSGDQPDTPDATPALDLDFEDGAAGFSGATTVADGPDGSNCLKWTATGGWSATEKAGVIVKPNTDYTLTFMAKGSVAGDMGITIQNGDWGAWWNGPTFAVTTAWKKVTLTFNTATYPNGSGAILFKFQDVGVAMDLYIDDLLLVEKTAGGDQPDEPEQVEVAVNNGDFETGNSNGWEIHQSSVVEAAAAHGGAYGAHLKGAGNWNGLLNQAITVNAGKTYVVSFWVKVNANGVNFQIKTGANGDMLANEWVDGNIAANCEWIQKEFTVIATTGTLFLNFCGAGNGIAEDVFVDDVTIVELKSASFDGYITNGDFEIGEIAPWDNLWGSNQVEMVAGHKGEYAAKITSVSWGHVRQTVAVEANTDYSITIWHKNASNVALLVKDGGDSVNIAQGTMSSGDAWTKTVLEFNSGAYTTIFVSIMGNEGGGQGIYDDISMAKKTGDEPDQPDQPDVPPSHPTELINGDFEDGINGWTVNGSASISEDGHKSAASLKLDNPSAWAEVALQTVSVQKNTNYVITWYSKRLSGNGAFFMVLNDGSSDYSPISGQSWMNETSGEWVRNEVIINTGSSQIVRFKLTAEAAGAGVLLIDDIKMIIEGSEPVDPNASLIKNGSFEDGRSDWNWGGTSAVISDDYYAEGHAAQLTNPSAWGVGVEQVVKVEKNTDYVLRFYTKRVNGSGVWMLSLMDNDTVNITNVNIEVTSGQKWFSPGNKWEEHVIEFNSADVTKVLVKFGPEADNAGSILVDYIGMWTKGNEPSPDNPDDPDSPIVPPKTMAFMTSFGVLNNRPISQDSNLLANPSFEKTGGEWTEGFNGDTITIVKDSTTLFGSKSLFFNTAGIEEETKLVFWVDVEPDTAYVFSTWLKGAYLADDNRGNATIGIINDNGKYLSNLHTENDITAFLNGERQIVPTAWDNEWHLRGIEFNSGECDKIGIAMSGKNSQMWIDDMALFKVGEGKKYMSDNAAGTISLSYDIDEVACKDKDSLIPDPTFSKGGNDFWKSSYGWRNGFLTFAENEYEYGTSLKYTATSDYAPLSIIKTIEVEPHTDYTFAVDVKVLEDGWGKLMLCDGKIREPLTFLEVSFDSYDYDPEYGYYGWYTTVCKFNTDVYDSISLVIVDDGGEALLDNMRLFKSEDGAAVTDKFVAPPEEPTPDAEEPSDDDWYEGDDWYDEPIVDKPIVDEPIIEKPDNYDDPVDEPEPVPDTPTAPVVLEQANNDWIWIAIAGGAVLLAGAGVFLFFFLKKKKTTPANPETPAE